MKPKDIAALLNVSTRHVYRCLQGENDRAETPVLNAANYIKAIKRGYDTKEDLAKYFCVRKETLLNFEKESGVLQLMAKYLYVQGQSLSAIGQNLHLRIGSIEIPSDFPTIETVRQNLGAILEVYEEMAKYGDAETVRYNDLKRLLDKL